MLSKETLELLEQYNNIAEQLLELHVKISCAIEEDTGSINLCFMNPSTLELQLWSHDDTREDVLALATTTPEVETFESMSDGRPAALHRFSINNTKCCTIVREAQ